MTSATAMFFSVSSFWTFDPRRDPIEQPIAQQEQHDAQQSEDGGRHQIGSKMFGQEAANTGL